MRAARCRSAAQQLRQRLVGFGLEDAARRLSVAERRPSKAARIAAMSASVRRSAAGRAARTSTMARTS